MSQELDQTDLALLAAARVARAQAYAPYSGFAVGAALLCADGTVFTGCNVENASYGLSICAERAVMAAAVAAGHRDHAAIAVAVPAAHRSTPCGACRQWMTEFNPRMRVLLAGPGDAVTATSAADLLPGYFEL